MVSHSGVLSNTVETCKYGLYALKSLSNSELSHIAWDGMFGGWALAPMVGVPSTTSRPLVSCFFFVFFQGALQKERVQPLKYNTMAYPYGNAKVVSRWSQGGHKVVTRL